jgi:hypothetical protein
MIFVICHVPCPLFLFHWGVVKYKMNNIVVGLWCAVFWHQWPLDLVYLVVYADTNSGHTWFHSLPGRLLSWLTVLWFPWVSPDESWNSIINFVLLYHIQITIHCHPVPFAIWSWVSNSYVTNYNLQTWCSLVGGYHCFGETCYLVVYPKDERHQLASATLVTLYKNTWYVALRDHVNSSQCSKQYLRERLLLSEQSFLLVDVWGSLPARVKSVCYNPILVPVLLLYLSHFPSESMDIWQFHSGISLVGISLWTAVRFYDYRQFLWPLHTGAVNFQVILNSRRVS